MCDFLGLLRTHAPMAQMRRRPCRGASYLSVLLLAMSAFIVLLGAFSSVAAAATAATQVEVQRTPNLRPGMTAVATVAATGTGSISGTVRTSGGAALAGVEVDVYDQEFNLLGSARTNSAGAYSITALSNVTVCVSTFNLVGYVDEWYDDIVLPGNWTAAGATWLSLSSKPTRTGVNFQLDVGRSISGKVTDDSGAGLPNVAAEAIGFDGYVWSFGITDANGDYTIGGLPLNQYRVATYNIDYYVDEWYDNVIYPKYPTGTGAKSLSVVSSNVTGIDFTLAAGRYLMGQVSDSRNYAIRGMGVDVYDLSETLVASTVTDGGGYYMFLGLPAGRYYLRTNDTGDSYVDVWYWNTPVINTPSPYGTGGIDLLTAAGRTGLNFTLASGHQFNGHVTDSSGNPLSGIDVVLRYQSDYNGALLGSVSATTDATGYWTAKKLPVGNYKLHTSNDLGYIDEWSDGQLFPGHLDGSTVTARHVGDVGAWPTADFSLDRGHTISGIVTDNTTGQALAGPKMEVQIVDGSGVVFASDWVGAGVTSSYTTWAVPSGTYYAKTTDSLGTSYIEEWYDNLQCGRYTLPDATAFTVAGANVTGIDFGLDRMTRVEQSDPRILHLGTWSTVSDAAASGASYARTNTPGSCANIAFTGTRLDITAAMTPAASYGKVYLDGVDAGYLNLYAETVRSAKVWSSGLLANGPHIVRVDWHLDNGYGTTYRDTTLDAVEVAGTLTTALPPPVPTVTALAPSSGPNEGGTPVVVTGTNFLGAYRVTFGGVASTYTTVDSATQITCWNPPHVSGLVDVQVFTPGGASATSGTGDDFRYLSPVTVTRYDQTNADIVKTGTWTDYSSSSAYAGSYGRSSTAGASATVWFTGTKIAWIGMKGTTPGIVDVYLDGEKKATLDLYAAPVQYRGDPLYERHAGRRRPSYGPGTELG